MWDTYHRKVIITKNTETKLSLPRIQKQPAYRELFILYLKVYGFTNTKARHTDISVMEAKHTNIPKRPQNWFVVHTSQ
jgi:hypothetical protein